MGFLRDQSLKAIQFDYRQGIRSWKLRLIPSLAVILAEIFNAEDRCGNALFACSIAASTSGSPVALSAHIIKPVSLSNVIYHPSLCISKYKVHGHGPCTKM